MTVEDLVLAAVEKNTPAERAAYLSAACQGALRGQVESLLRAHDDAGGLLDQPLFQAVPTCEPAPPPRADRHGTGLLQQLTTDQ